MEKKIQRGRGRPKAKETECTYCNKLFPAPWRARRHEKEKHENPNKMYEPLGISEWPWNCKICTGKKAEKEWKYPNTFKEHLEMYHTGGEVFKAGYKIKKYYEAFGRTTRLDEYIAAENEVKE